MRINCVNLLILTLILPGCTHRAPLNTSANDGRASANAKTIATLNVAANNPNHSIIHRSQAIFTLFRGFIKPGCPVQDVQAILRDPRWLDHSDQQVSAARALDQLRCSSAEMLTALPLDKDKPSAIICHTVKGKGVPYAENNMAWHHQNKVSAADADKLIAALEANV